jgi:hypothetical protein
MKILIVANTTWGGRVALEDGNVPYIIWDRI